MKRINKGKSPKELKTWLKATPAADRLFDGVKDEVRESSLRSLEAEQGGLCAYCMGAIGVAQRPTRIEHYVNQKDPARGQKLQVHWNNWLGVCHSTGKDQHCDGSRGKLPVLLRPARKLVPAVGAEKFSRSVLQSYDAEDLIRYGTDGGIYIDKEKASRKGLDEGEVTSLQTELDTVLNLNMVDLKAARSTVLRTAIAEVNKLHKGPVQRQAWDPEVVKNVLSKYEKRGQNGRFREYCMIVVNFLKAKIQSLPAA
jgi:uncharacterized protein (TIGR02646 family)